MTVLKLTEKECSEIKIIGVFISLETEPSQPTQEVFLRFRCGKTTPDGFVSAYIVEKQITGQLMYDFLSRFQSLESDVYQFLIDNNIFMGTVE